MSHIRVETERVVAARPEEVYSVLSDYKEQRPKILTPNFLEYTVEKGGRGAGTEVRYRLHAARRERPYHIRVKEPLKGTVLTEQDTNSSLVTTWTIMPVQDGQQTNVHIISEWQGGSGIGGFFERTFAPLGLRRIYRTMLASLASLVASPKTNEDVLTGTGETKARLPFGLVLLVLGVIAVGAIVIGYLRQRNASNA